MSRPIPAAPPLLVEEVQTLWPEVGRQDWTALTPDGSDRTYWRLGAPGQSVVLMVYRGQNATSIEGFLEVHRLLEAHGLPIARLEAQHAETGLFLIEDLGDTTLEAASIQGPHALYPDAIELLVRIQAIQPPATTRPRCFELAFDAEKLGFEMNFFFQHLVQGLLGMDIERPEAQAAKTELLGLCHQLGSQHPVLTHRDYHCRNLMVHQGRLRLIDYQDARMGRHSYDLVSLLYDSYLDLGPDLRQQLLHQYETLRQADGLPQDWQDQLRPMALQRNLKALGSFGYLMTQKGKSHFAGSIASTFRHLREHLPDPRLPATSAFVLGPLQERCAGRGFLGQAPA